MRGKQSPPVACVSRRRRHWSTHCTRSRAEIALRSGSPEPQRLSRLVDPALQAWNAVKETASQVVLEDFIRRFGDTIYGTLARDRLMTLKKKSAGTPPLAVKS